MTPKRDPARPDAGRAAYDFLAGGGQMGHLIREHDWSATPARSVETWPQSLRSAVSILLPSRAQIVLFWGPELIAIYNDAYAPVFGAKHPWATRSSSARVLERGVARPRAALRGRGRHRERRSGRRTTPSFSERQGFLEETYFDVSYDPVRIEDGSVGGVFCIVSEQTGRVARRTAPPRPEGARHADGGREERGGGLPGSGGRSGAGSGRRAPVAALPDRRPGGRAELVGAAGVKREDRRLPR